MRQQRFSGIFFLISVFIVWSSSCSYFSRSNEEEPLARVKDHFLYRDDLSNLLHADMNATDSAQVTRNYIHNWVNEMLLLQKAELNLKEEQKDFQKQLESYRNSLLIYEYEKKIIQQQLDTIVLLDQIEDYYLTNQQNFTLKDNVVKVTYAQITKDAPGISKIRSLYRSEREEDRTDFLDYCHQYAFKLYNDDNWILFDELLKNVPLSLSQRAETFLKNNKHIEVQDSTSHYFVNIHEYKIKNSKSPLSFEKARIRNIILNQRKLNLLKQMKQDLYNTALVKKDFEIYE